MRFFSAIPLPENLKTAVADITRGRLPVPYVNTANLHITLNFFGELDGDSRKLLVEIFSEPVEGAAKFPVSFSKVAKVRTQIHLLPKPNPELDRLQAGMEQYYSERGFAFQNRPYYAHMKLANLHMDKVMHPERKIENFPNDELGKLDFIADKVVLYESKLLLHHAHHSPILEIPLT